MSFIGDGLKDIVEGTTNVTLLFSGIVAVAFVCGMFYGVAFESRNTFYWPIYILALILVLKVITEIKISKIAKKK